MKRTILIVIAAAWATLSGVAQDTPRSSALSTAERQELTEITLRIEEKTRVARAELDILQAQLKRLLLSANADLEEVRDLLTQAMRWELDVRLAEIERELQIRKVIGDKRWAQYVRAQRTQQTAAARALIEEHVERLVSQLVRLTGEKRESVIERVRTAIRQSVTKAVQATAQSDQ